MRLTETQHVFSSFALPTTFNHAEQILKDNNIPVPELQLVGSGWVLLVQEVNGFYEKFTIIPGQPNTYNAALFYTNKGWVPVSWYSLATKD